MIPQAPQRLLGNALAVRLTIVNDRDILITPALGQVVTTMIAWSVSRPHTRNTWASPCSVSVGLLGVRRDHENSRLRVDLRRRNRSAGTEVSDDRGHARLHEFVGRGDRLVGVSSIIDDQELDPLAEHATRRVQLGDLHVHALLHLLAEQAMVPVIGPAAPIRMSACADVVPMATTHTAANPEIVLPTLIAASLCRERAN